KNQFIELVPVTRCDLMKLSRINSRTTFARYIQNLQDWGYVEEYLPQHNPKLRSFVKMKSFPPGVNKQHSEVLQPNDANLSNSNFSSNTEDTCPRVGHLTENTDFRCPLNGHLT